MPEAKTRAKKSSITEDNAGQVVVMLGNEGIARGMVEAGVQVVAGYPGTPASEIVDSLADVASQTGMHVQWSTNEKVAVEVAAAGSMAGLRSAATMKSLGLNVALEILMQLNVSGVGKGGMVVVFCDDPGALSSTNEQDTRWIARMSGLPLLEPSSPQEAKEMVKWAFEVSEKLKALVLVRSATRISHSTGQVTLGEIQPADRKARFDTTQRFITRPGPQKHAEALQRLDKAKEIFESCSFNSYSGPESPKLYVICCGTGWLYAQDAIEELGQTGSIGVIKLSTVSPLPIDFIKKHVKADSTILVVEEGDAFVEGNLKELLYDGWKEGGRPTVLGKKTGHIDLVGELTPDMVIDGIAKAMGVRRVRRDAGYDKRIKEYAARAAIARDLTWCPGCPHRASYWTIKKMIKLDGTDGVIFGDIGCYAMEREMTKSVLCMGAGSGIASGFGVLRQFGHNQLTLASCGDSTFYHAAFPALVNCIHHQSNVTVIIYDNNATGMTGFQVHPGLPADAMGGQAVPIKIENICRAMGCHVEIADPFDVADTEAKLWKLIEEQGTKVLILRRDCGLMDFRKNGPKYKVWVDQEKCIGETCGCNQHCIRTFKCPALIWQKGIGKVRIDEALCTGCGFCTSVCPQGAFQRREA